MVAAPTAELKLGVDCVIADINQADFGRKELDIAETEMPGLMALREKYGSEKFSRSPHRRLLHMTIQTAVLIETLGNWAPKCAGPPATSSPPRITPPQRSPPATFLCSPSRAKPWRSTGSTPIASSSGVMAVPPT